mgnify:CR=1 FL=1
MEVINLILKMIAIIKQGSSLESINKILKKLSEKKKKGIDAKKYCGVLFLTEDALATQNKMRNEWE